MLPTGAAARVVETGPSHADPEVRRPDPSRKPNAVQRGRSRPSVPAGRGGERPHHIHPLSTVHRLQASMLSGLPPLTCGSPSCPLLNSDNFDPHVSTRPTGHRGRRCHHLQRLHNEWPVGRRGGTPARHSRGSHRRSGSSFRPFSPIIRARKLVGSAGRHQQRRREAKSAAWAAPAAVSQERVPSRRLPS